MSGAAAVMALVLLESTAGVVAIAAWTQSWAVVKRGHFRIVAGTAATLAVLAAAAGSGATDGLAAGLPRALALATGAGAFVYLVVQYSRTDLPGVVVGFAAGALGSAALLASAGHLSGWPWPLAALELVAGAALTGSVANGMLLGHWYLNQPGLRPWALARLTNLALFAAAAALLLGALGAPRLVRADTEGAVLGLPGFGESFGPVFFVIWSVLVAFTVIVLWLARRCIGMRSIQSATGLYYVALLTAAVSEFLVRYLMVNSGG